MTGRQRITAGLCIAFALAACSGGDSTGPSGGTLQINISGLPGGPANVVVTGPGGYQHSVTSTTTLSGLALGSYTATSHPVAQGGETYATTQGTLTVSVGNAGGNASADFTYVLTTGHIDVTISGLPNGVNAKVIVSGGPPGTPADTLHAAGTVHNLPPGAYTVRADFVSQGSTTFGGLPRSTSVAVTATPTAANATITYSAMTGELDIVVDTIAGALLPNVVVTGPFGYSHNITKLDTTALTSLPLGTYAVNGSPVRNATDEFTPSGLPDSESFESDASKRVVTVHHLVSSVAFRVTFRGLPGGTDGSAPVTGPSGFSQTFNSQTLVHFLPVGNYDVRPSTVTGGGVQYFPDPIEAGFPCAPSVTPCGDTITYAPLDLLIDGMYLTQATQAYDGHVPLVAGRDALLRVFTGANRNSFKTANVRVKLYSHGSLVHTDTILNAPTYPGGAGNQVNYNWTANLHVPGALVQPGLAATAEVDFDGQIAESNETNNLYPASGTPQPIDVRVTDSAHITFVPVTIPLPAGGTGVVGDATQFLSFANKIHPLPGIVVSVHPAYTTTVSAVLQDNDANGEWVEIITELAALRTADNAPANEMYYGVVDPPYSAGVAGLGFIGYPVAMGWDLTIREEILAHEIGHNWGQLHAPCGGPSGVDPNYPYPGASIGTFGWDAGPDSIFDPGSTYDVMSYCRPYWTGDYTWDSVMSFRAQNAYDIVRAQNDMEGPSLLVWGREVDGKLTIEPAFEITTRAQMPDGRGPYSLEGLDESGGRVFSYAFTPHQIADGRPGSKSFVFAIPLSQIDATRLGELRVSGLGRSANVKRSAGAAAPSQLRSRAEGGGRSALTWNAAAYPMAIVRDARTGKVLSFARRGSVIVKGSGAGLEITLSDGVRSVKESVSPQ